MYKQGNQKLKFIFFLCIMFSCLGIRFIEASAGENDFQIDNNVLVKYIGNDTTVEVPAGIIQIGQSAFEGSKVVKVILPSTVTKIGDYAFNNCKELEHIELQNSVKSIGYCAFKNCKKLEGISLPDSLSTINNSAFESSGLLKVTLPSALTQIKGGVFYECKKLKSIDMPKNLKVIGGMAFEMCYSLEKVTIPENVTRVGLEAFAYCYSLQNIVINSSKIEKVGDHPFLFHAANRKVVFKKKVSEKYKKKFDYQDYITKGAVLYHRTSSSTVDMCAVKYTKKGKLTVPKKVGKYTVTGVKKMDGVVGETIGSLHKGITQVILADTIKKLGAYVFEFSSFTKIKLPKDLTRIEEYALYGNHLKEIHLPSKLKYVGERAFVRTFYAKDKDIVPDGVDQLPKSILIPESVKTIEDGNFGYYEINYPLLDEGEDGWDYVKIKNYKIKGRKGSYAQKYAKKHGLKFVVSN